MNSPVWITGARGLIGDYLIRTAPAHAPGREIIGLTRAKVDLNDFAAVRRAFTEQKPGLIIHCAAMTKIAACEENPALAKLTNVEATRNLAGLSAEIPFVFFSTDMVYDGRKGNYVETDAVNPHNVYGGTKAEAEEVVRAHPRHIILRAALNAGRSPAGNTTFNEQMHLAWQAGRAMNLFIDEFRCPIPAMITARAVWELSAANVTGTFNLGGAEKLSRLEIGKLLAARWPELKPQIIPGSVKDFKGPPRNPDTSMISAKAQAVLSFPLPKFSEWLVAHPGELT